MNCTFANKRAGWMHTERDSTANGESLARQARAKHGDENRLSAFCPLLPRTAATVLAAICCKPRGDAETGLQKGKTENHHLFKGALNAVHPTDFGRFATAQALDAHKPPFFMKRKVYFNHLLITWLLCAVCSVLCAAVEGVQRKGGDRARVVRSVTRRFAKQVCTAIKPSRIVRLLRDPDRLY